MDLGELQQKALEIARTKGFFWKHRDEAGALDAIVPKSLAHLHSEVSELYEEYRRAADGPAMSKLWIEGFPREISFEEMLTLAAAGHKPLGPASEAADVVIQIAELSMWLGINLVQAVAVKLAYYVTRPPKNGKVR